MLAAGNLSCKVKEDVSQHRVRAVIYKEGC